MGYQYVLTIVGVFSGWVEAFPCHKVDAPKVAKELLENMFSTWGLPSTISSDQGPHFTGQKIQALMKALQTS